MSRQTSGATWFERAATTVLPVALGAGVFIVAFIHVHDVACWSGQPSWASWLIAMTGEAMAVAGLAAITSRRRADAPIKWAVFVVVAAVLFSGACNLVAVLHRTGPGDPPGTVLHGEPGVWVGLMAVWPVLAFGLVAGLKATKPPHTDDETPAADVPRQTSPVRAAGYGRLYRDGGTAPDGGHMPTATADLAAIRVGENGTSDHVGVVVPVAAAWARTGLSDVDDDLAGHNGEHSNGHTGQSSLPPLGTRPAPAAAPVPAPREPTPAPARPVGDVTREASGGELWDVYTDADGRHHRVHAGRDDDATPPLTLAPATPPQPERAETAGPRLPAVQFRAPEPPAPAAVAATGSGAETDVSDLLDDGRKVRDGLAAAGRALNRSTLHAGLKERGHRAGTRRLDALLRELRAEPVGAGR
ncbi:hypothetical protein [Pseudofrankia asymbiotica]|uniref:DUF2637 domain-containing protein n=1 Tax=Pseudofrankia asymbiotica TaxID=1834516 RepID=A0A1V2I1V2_9ACTN|nr:hypothetical protein [Pseudofrankia asymbiotica]ONH23824.1 hypothetical protein BL253_31905 [Pseudofrankia asymbiotica]